MNATEHIAAAELLLTTSASQPDRTARLAEALVHATLAVAVATENGNRMRGGGMRQR